MKALETTATINESGQITLDPSPEIASQSALEIVKPKQVRVIILIDDNTPVDETTTSDVIEGIQEGIQQALSGETIPLSGMWSE